MVDLDSRETVTIYEVYTMYPSFNMTIERRNFFMNEAVAREHLEDLKEEAIKGRREKIKEWKQQIEEQDWREPSEDTDFNPEKNLKASIKSTREEIEILESDNYLDDREMPLGSLNSGETYPLITEVEVIK